MKTEKLTPLNYDDTFAYGCLHDIPIPNSTLETTFTPQQERAVLMEIFDQTDGHNWRKSTHWGNNSVSHCLWYGITCDQTNSYIISITLTTNNLVGALPRSLWKLRNLQGLCVGNNNKLLGNLFEILSTNMTTLLRLDLAFNKLSGEIPAEILPKIPSLVKVQLCCQLGKGLSSTIPRDIGNLSELQVLSIGENTLNGMIPKSIAKLKKLWFLDLESVSFLSGGFENLYNLSSLRYMHLSLAGLNGTLPDDFGLYFPAMIECLLPGNHFSGSIPSTMGNMTNLWHLNLANNAFSVLITLGFFFYEKKRFLSVTFVCSQIIILTVLAMLQIIPAWLLELNVIALFIGLAGRGKGARGIMKTSVFYFQTFDALLSNTDVWPVEVLETQRYIANVFNFRFSGLACEFPRLFTPLGELASLLILPLICILLVWFYFTLGYLVFKIFEYPNLEERRLRLRNTCLQLSVMTLNFTYFPIVKKTASTLAHCGEDNGQRYLREAPWMECEGYDYTILQVLGWLALPLYVIGVPFGLFLPLLHFNKVARRHEMPQQDQESLDSWLGSIYLPYREEFRPYFEIIFLLRRMLIAFALSLINRASSFQTIAVCFVLLVALCLQLSFRPLNDSYQKFPLENTAETLVLLTLHFSFMNVRYAALNPDSSLPIIWMIVSVNVVLLCGMVVSIILLLKKAGNADEMVHEARGHEEHAPVLGDGAREQYGTFEE